MTEREAMLAKKAAQQKALAEHGAPFFQRKWMRRVYSLYLQGRDVNSIILNLRCRYNLDLNEHDINALIDHLNQALL